MTTTSRDFEQELIAKAHPEKIAILSSFFKTAPGEYGEGDRFIGLTVPENRTIARRYIHLTCDELTPMLHSPIHEIRLAALLCMVEKYKNRRTAAELRQSIFDTYTRNTAYIKNTSCTPTAPYSTALPAPARCGNNASLSSPPLPTYAITASTTPLP